MLQKHIFQCVCTYKMKKLQQNVCCKRKQTVCVGRASLFFPSLRSLSLSLSVFVSPDHAAGVLAQFLAAVKTAPGKILSCKDQETLCAPVCVSLPGSYPDIIIKGDICVTDFFFFQVSRCVLFNIIALTQHLETCLGHWVGNC